MPKFMVIPSFAITANVPFPAEKGHSFGILKIVYENGLEVEAERMA